MNFKAKLVTISGTKNEATVLLEGAFVPVRIRDGEKSKLLSDFARGQSEVTIDLDVTSGEVIS